MRRRVNQQARKEKNNKTPKTTLTRRELQVLSLAAGGLNNKQVAAQLKLSEDTIDTHNRNITRRLGAKNVKEAIAMALRWKLIS